MAYSFGENEHKHWVLLGAIAMITFFLIVEARRFSYADVWRARVRMIEEFLYGPILRRDFGGIGNDWGKRVAEDLFRPRFRMSAFVAIRGRLVRNYWAIYVVTISAWLTKVLFVPVPIQNWEELKVKLGGGGFILWWSPLLLVGGFVVAAILLVLLAPPVTSHNLEQWKFEKSNGHRKGDLDV